MNLYIDYATNNAYDTIVLIRDGRIRSAWTVGQSDEMRAWLEDRLRPEDWDDQGLDLPLDHYGALIGDDEERLAERIKHHLRSREMVAKLARSIVARSARQRR